VVTVSMLLARSDGGLLCGLLRGFLPLTRIGWVVPSTNNLHHNLFSGLPTIPNLCIWGSANRNELPNEEYRLYLVKNKSVEAHVPELPAEMLNFRGAESANH
jgi:hypothetical protein